MDETKNVFLQKRQGTSVQFRLKFKEHLLLISTKNEQQPKLTLAKLWEDKIIWMHSFVIQRSPVKCKSTNLWLECS